MTEEESQEEEVMRKNKTFKSNLHAFLLYLYSVLTF